MSMMFGKSRRIFIAGVVGVVLVCCLLMFCNLNRAHGQTDKKKTVTSVYIDEGDSLWSIASEYYTSECGDMKDYIQEISNTNHLNGDTIHAGNYLIIPYYR